MTTLPTTSPTTSPRTSPRTSPTTTATARPEPRSELDQALRELADRAPAWARMSIADRIAILTEIKDRVLAVSADWAETAAKHKQIPADSPLVGEEWLSGPYAVMAGCNGLVETLSKMDGRAFVDDLPTRTRFDGQVVVRTTPHSVWDRLLLSGVTAEVWMQPEVTEDNLRDHVASAYAVPPEQREPGVALVLGAGNIAAIPPLDCFHKLFAEHQVVLLKLNPVNDYLMPFFEHALQPLVAAGALRIVKGDGAAGAYLCTHDGVDEIHITGSHETHDRIVWGADGEARANRANNTPKLRKRITSELGAVCPTIVVPGPWTDADLRFQAEQIATQKLHNSGFNCVSMQVLVVPDAWQHTDSLLDHLGAVIGSMQPRGLYYPGASSRLEAFAEHTDGVRELSRLDSVPCLCAAPADSGDWMREQEVFGPAFGTVRLPDTNAEAYLEAAIDYANTQLHGTLGANIVIHPATVKAIGADRFEDIIAELRYGCIAINAWTGVAFLLAECPWGAFPGHTLQDVGSGIGFVHNSWMFDKPQRTVVRAPFRPFPRTAASGGTTLLPRPPWFSTNRQGAVLGRLLTAFQHSPSWLKVPAIFSRALRG